MQENEKIIGVSEEVKKRILIGETLIKVFRLKENKKETYNPKRYITARGNKTALGIYETVKRIIEE